MEAGLALVAGAGVCHVVIAQLHGEMRENLDADPLFASRVSGVAKADEGPAGRPTPPPGDRPRPGTGGTLPPRPKPKASSKPRRRTTATRRKRS